MTKKELIAQAKELYKNGECYNRRRLLDALLRRFVLQLH